MARATPSRNSSTLSGRMAMPRSPAAQLPAGRLCSTCVSPCWCNCSRSSALSKSYGNRYSTPLNPAALAAAKRSRNGCSPNSMVRLAANLGTSGLLDLCRQQLARLRCARFGRRVVERQIEHLLEFDDIVDLGAHRDVGEPSENEFDDDRHLELRHPCPRGGERRLRMVRIRDADRLAAQSLGDRDVVDAIDPEFRCVDVLEGKLDMIVHVE